MGIRLMQSKLILKGCVRTAEESDVARQIPLSCVKGDRDFDGGSGEKETRGKGVNSVRLTPPFIAIGDFGARTSRPHST